MERIQPFQTTQSLSRHRPLHRVAIGIYGNASGTAYGYRLHRPERIAQVPRQHVHFRIHMAGSARHRAVPGQFGVIEKPATLANERRSGIVASHGNLAQYRVPSGIDDRKRVGNAIQDVEPLRNGIQRQTARAALGAGIDRGPGRRTHFDASEHIPVRIDPRMRSVPKAAT